jgi:hypothetical protein
MIVFGRRNAAAPIPRPVAESLNQFVTGLSGALTAYERKVVSERGRAGLRRLNAYEYENSIRALLNIPWAQIKSKLRRMEKRGGITRSAPRSTCPMFSSPAI